MLTIIIPQFNETFDFMKPLFTSLDTQRLIDFGQLEIIVVNDCGIPLQHDDFNSLQHIRPHLISTPVNSGVGVARQIGADNARGDFLMYVDADDCLFSPTTLFRIMSAINDKPDTDLFHGQFVEEQIIDDKYGLYLHEKDITFCHGKIYRTAFLRDNNIKCHPTLRYNEDSYYNALIYACANKIEYIDTPLIIWCCNTNSTVRCGGLYAYEKLPDYIKSVTDLCTQLVQRQKYQAKTTFLQALNYIYFQLQDEAWKTERVKKLRPAVIKAAHEFFTTHEKLYDCGNTERLNFFNECRISFATPIMESQTFTEFIEEVRTWQT